MLLYAPSVCVRRGTFNLTNKQNMHSRFFIICFIFIFLPPLNFFSLWKQLCPVPACQENESLCFHLPDSICLTFILHLSVFADSCACVCVCVARALRWKCWKSAVAPMELIPFLFWFSHAHKFPILSTHFVKKHTTMCGAVHIEKGESEEVL